MAAPAAVGLNLSGKVFFGGLCAGTFYLGTWQTQRYFEKISLMEKRVLELKEDPVWLKDNDDDAPLLQGFRRRLIEGTYRHEDEMLVGPRGPPVGALTASGPASGRSEGGMSSGPQGYYVITPFATSKKRTLLINRGWIPRNYLESKHNAATVDFYRPTGPQTIVSVPGKCENPRFMVPQHDVPNRRLYWFDMDTMEKLSGLGGKSTTTQMMIQVRNSSSKTEEPQYPAQPPEDAVGEYKLTPLVHAGYAVTWFGLSGAGLIMTRKLVTRGRG